MIASPSLLTTLFAFLLVLGPLVLIHELGHYLVGRWFGVKADAFSIGFGKEIAGWTDKRGTRWKFSALPLGGYVQFAGDLDATSAPGPLDPDLPEAQRKHTFQAQPLWRRALIVLAGPMTNLLFAVLIAAAFYLAYGKSVAEPIVADFFPNSAAQAAGMQIGDRITAIDGHDVETLTDIPDLVTPYPGQTVTIAYDRDGRTRKVPVKLGVHQIGDDFGNKADIGSLGINFALPVIGKVMDDSPAAAAGVRAGDRVMAVDKQTIRSFDQIAALVTPNPGKRVTLTVMRENGATLIPLTIGSHTVELPGGKSKVVGLIGIEASVGKIVEVGPLEAVGLGFERSIGIMKMMGTGLVQIITGDRSVKELGGPIKIAQYSGQQFTLGWEDFIGFVAMISINLAFINLLPIPGLDGGHLAFYAAEAVRRKPLGVRSQEWAMRTGVALVLALMVFVTVNDVASLPIFGG